MPAGSRQAVLVEPRHFEMRALKPPHPGPGEILLKVKCALSCGTDLKFYRRGHPLFKFPMPFGHEFSGVVAEVGADVENFRPGDELMAAPTAPCGKCFFCGRGQENLCVQVIDTMVMGAYADFLLLPAHVVARNAFKQAGLPAVRGSGFARTAGVRGPCAGDCASRKVRDLPDSRRRSVRAAPPLLLKTRRRASGGDCRARRRRGCDGPPNWAPTK